MAGLRAQATGCTPFPLHHSAARGFPHSPGDHFFSSAIHDLQLDAAQPADASGFAMLLDVCTSILGGFGALG